MLHCIHRPYVLRETAVNIRVMTSTSVNLMKKRTRIVDHGEFVFPLVGFDSQLTNLIC